MNTIERIVQIILQAAITFIVVLLGIRLVTGCAIIKTAVPKDKVVEAIKTAYAEGGRDAVSNRIERLVADGTLSAKQAEKLHGVAQTLYDRVVEKLEAEIAKGCVDGEAR